MYILCQVSFTYILLKMIKKNKISNYIKEFRKNNDMTQEELAKAAGVSRQSINAIEKGKYIPSLPLALRLRSIFNCSTDDLFELDE